MADSHKRFSDSCFANNLFELKPSMHKTRARIHTVKACQIMNSQACRQNNDKHDEHDKLGRGGRGHGMSWSDVCSVGSSPDRSMQIAMTSCSDSSDSASGASGASAAVVAASVDAAGADGAGGASVPNVLTVPRVCECPRSMDQHGSACV